jgi:hypothetical protein
MTYSRDYITDQALTIGCWNMGKENNQFQISGYNRYLIISKWKGQYWLCLAAMLLFYNSVQEVSAFIFSRDKEWWKGRETDANGASLFFICIYLHIGRNIYYGSYKLIHTWSIKQLMI